MSFDLHSFNEEADINFVSVKISSHPPLIKLAKTLP